GGRPRLENRRVLKAASSASATDVLAALGLPITASTPLIWLHAIACTVEPSSGVGVTLTVSDAPGSAEPCVVVPRTTAATGTRVTSTADDCAARTDTDCVCDV